MLRRTTQYLFQRHAKQLWQPFNQGKIGYDLSTYGFGAAATEIVVDAQTVPAVINGFAGQGIKFVEDFFLVVTSGFDIVSVAESSGRGDEEEERSAGAFTLAHSRSFLGWKSTGSELLLPYSLKLELSSAPHRIRSITLNCDLAAALRGSGRECPPEVLACVESPSALHMLVALRRAKVKPDFISHRALLSGTKKEETWCNALGLL